MQVDFEMLVANVNPCITVNKKCGCPCVVDNVRKFAESFHWTKMKTV